MDSIINYLCTSCTSMKLAIRVAKGNQLAFFGLSAIVVHESRWRDFINALIQFKKTMRVVYGLPARREIHASEIIKKKMHGLARHERLAILRNTLDELAKLDYISITNVIVDKNGKPPDYDVFVDGEGISAIGAGADERCTGRTAVRALLQRNFDEATAERFEWHWREVMGLPRFAVGAATLTIHL